MLNLTKLEGFDAKVAILSKYVSECLRRPGETEQLFPFRYLN